MGLAEEDSVALDDIPETTQEPGMLDIAVILLPHVSNYDDFDPLAGEPDVHLHYVHHPHQLGHPDLIIIPGTKTTLADLAALRDRGLADAIVQCYRRGTPIMGICGGYQMLGQYLADPHGTEGGGEMAGLDLLPVATTFATTKTTVRVHGYCLGGTGILQNLQGIPISGYEIHMGQTKGTARPAFAVDKRPGQSDDTLDGAVSTDGLVVGTYIHGLFASDAFRHGLLDNLRRRKGLASPIERGHFDRQQAYDRLAAVVRARLDMAALYRIIGLPVHPNRDGPPEIR